MDLTYISEKNLDLIIDYVGEMPAEKRKYPGDSLIIHRKRYDKQKKVKAEAVRLVSLYEAKVDLHSANSSTRG